ncbi:MAG: hypothetical protein E7256_13175 [Lachnospiraceae bacterium]|nr:hypothetical protein [Lachnospiraceae bacterium]
MDTILSQVFHAISAVMFCMAITILFTAVDISSDIFTKALKLNQKEGVEEYVPAERNSSAVSFAELWMIVSTELEYDVEINGTYILKEGYYGLESLELELPRGSYRKQYVYDDSGNILFVRYTAEH